METETEWATVPVELIDLSPFLVREYFDEEAMKKLANGIEERGLLHPVTVRRVCDRYELLAGERRYRAINEYLKRETIAVGIIIADDQEARRVIAIENWLQDRLSAIEELELTVAMVDDELAKDAPYSTSENTPLKRVDKLLSKLHSIKVSRDRGSTVSDSSEQLFNNFVKQLDQFFENLPKPLTWQSFFTHDLPILLQVPERVRKDAIEQKLNRHQIRALIELWKASPEVYNQTVKYPGSVFERDSNTDAPDKVGNHSAREIREVAKKHRAAAKDKAKTADPKPKYEREFQILKMRRLGFSQEKIAQQTGANYRTVAKIIQHEETLFCPIRKGLRQWKTPEEVAEELLAPSALVWSVKLEGLTDKERFRQLGWGVNTWDYLYWAGLDERFGDNWPGRIPARLVAHALYAYSKPGDLIMDPMAGGGVTSDVCLLLDRRCRAFDLKNRQEQRPEIETFHWNPEALQWPLSSQTKPMLIFFDPPYFSKMSDEYGPESISALSREQYLDFFREFFILAHRYIQPGGYIAFLNSDWRDFEGKSAMEEDRSKAITVVNYSNLLMETGWDNPTIWDSPLPTQRFEPIEVARMQDLHSVGVVRRSLIIAQRVG